MKNDPAPEQWLKELLIDLHRRVRQAVRDELATQNSAFLSEVVRDGAGDVTFQVDVRPEELVTECFSEAREPVIVISEGLGRRVFPAGASEHDARWCVIIDPLDGSREIAYGKRSAWVLSGIAPAWPPPTLADILWAVQTEVPLPGQSRGAVIVAAREQGVHCGIWDLAQRRLVGNVMLRSSAARSVRGGFAIFADYFAGAHAATGSIADAVFSRVPGGVIHGGDDIFNDQYLSTGGCLYLLAAGTYRFYADLRPSIGRRADGREPAVGLCAHPYDLCTYLIATEAGVIVTDLAGKELSYPLGTDIDCEWVGYANSQIATEMGPALAAALQEETGRRLPESDGP